MDGGAALTQPIQQGDSRQYNGEQVYYTGGHFARYDIGAAGVLAPRLPTVFGRGTTSACFMETKPPHKYARLTFYANVDQVVRLARIGQLEVLR
jgi:hypothetical protein